MRVSRVLWLSIPEVQPASAERSDKRATVWDNIYQQICPIETTGKICTGSNKLEFVNNVEILGRVFSNNLSAQDHIDIRIRNSQRAMYSIDLNNQALSPSVKAYL